MTFIILAVVAAVAIFIGTGFKHVGSNWGWKVNPKQWLSLLALVIAAFSFFTIVPANSVGIVYSPFSGGVQDNVLDEGIQNKGPFDTVYTLSTEVQTTRLPTLHGQTKDAQFLTISIDVKYQVNPVEAVKVFQNFRTLDNVNAQLVEPVAQRAIEEATTKYNIMEILGDKRTEVYTEIELSLKKRFENDGLDVHSITFLDTDGGEEIEQAIRNEAVEKKAYDTAQRREERAKIEKKTVITQAEGEAEAKRILAEAISNNPQVLELEWIKKWDGILPIYMSGDGGNVMLDLTELQKQAASAPAPSPTQAPSPSPTSTPSE